MTARSYLVGFHKRLSPIVFINRHISHFCEYTWGIRYFRQAAGLNGAEQICNDLGAKADPRKLAPPPPSTENSTARRLGYLLEHFRHARQAISLRPLALKAKSFKPLDPSVRVVAGLARAKAPDAPAWKLSLNVPLEIDA